MKSGLRKIRSSSVWPTICMAPPVPAHGGTAAEAGAAEARTSPPKAKAGLSTMPSTRRTKELRGWLFKGFG
ncbi:hypothetical protein AAHB34_04750 [Paenarthrobacter ureafaciens]